MSADKLELYVSVQLDPLQVRIRPIRLAGAPVTAVLTIGDSLKMPVTISIDDTNGKANVIWIDDKGDTDAPRPDGAVVSFSSDNPAVATVAPDPSNPDAADITPVAEGVTNISVTFSDATGGPLMEPDGVTPFQVQPAPITVGPGAAAGAGLEINP